MEFGEQPILVGRIAEFVESIGSPSGIRPSVVLVAERMGSCSAPQAAACYSHRRGWALHLHLSHKDSHMTPSTVAPTSFPLPSPVTVGVAYALPLAAAQPDSGPSGHLWLESCTLVEVGC